MNTPPASTDLDPKDITRVIARHWSIDVGSMTYLPLGFGSHHWLADVRGSSAQSLFVTADRVASGSAAELELRRALTAAWHLRHRAGIAAVVAPMQTDDGEILVPVNAQWVVALYPYVAVETSEWGEYTNEEDRRRAQQLVALVHSVDPSTLPADAPPVEDFAI
ncbi:MAG TPA: hypothetical protein VEW66_06695, partial [Thermomicrobiales bacterium]|nr:hypothetical protein [Thermomicrobiales bacterium]